MYIITLSLLPEWPIEGVRNIELEKELEKRMRRRGEDYKNKDRYHDDVKENNEILMSTKSSRVKDIKHKYKGHSTEKLDTWKIKVGKMARGLARVEKMISTKEKGRKTINTKMISTMKIVERIISIMLIEMRNREIRSIKKVVVGFKGIGTTSIEKKEQVIPNTQM